MQCWHWMAHGMRLDKKYSEVTIYRVMVKRCRDSAHYKKKGKECRPKPHTLTEISRHSKYKSVG
jgi:hypothetical protein